MFFLSWCLLSNVLDKSSIYSNNILVPKVQKSFTIIARTKKVQKLKKKLLSGRYWAVETRNIYR